MIIKYLKKTLKSIDRFFHRKFSSENNPLADPLRGDRCIEYAFVIEYLHNEKKDKKVLDIGSCESPLTTIVASLGFQVDAIDLIPSPVHYKNVRYINGNFLNEIDRQKLKKYYDIIVLCSTIEHFGLKRYGSPEIPGADLDCLKIARGMLQPKGKLILTIPYGVEKIINPWHRVYNKKGPLLSYLFSNFKVEVEEYYKNNSQNIWVSTTENEAAKVIPREDLYALGLFVCRKN